MRYYQVKQKEKKVPNVGDNCPSLILQFKINAMVIYLTSIILQNERI